MPETGASETVEKTDAAGAVDDPSSGTGLRGFGNKLLKIPCMRSSLLNGYIGAVIGGLAGLFYTSNVRMGAHSALASYWIVAIGSWSSCRYKLNKENLLWENIIQHVNESRVKKDEYNLPAGVTKLNQNGESDSAPVKHS